MHEWIINPYSMALFASAFLAAMIARALWKRRESPGALPLALFMAASSFWAATYALELGSPAIEDKQLWARVAVIAIPFLPPLALVMTLQYLRKDSWLTKSRSLFLFSWPVIAILLYLTNDLHGWVWENFRMIPAGPIYTLKADPNWFFWLYVGYSYLLLILIAILLVHDFRNGNRERRQRTGIILAGMMISWGINTLSTFDILSLPDIDWTPVSFIILGAFGAWGLFRMNMFSLPAVSAERLKSLLTPSISPLLEEDHRRARWLAATSLIALALLGILALIRATVSSADQRNIVPTATALIVAYFLSRTSYYKIGIWILLAGIALLPTFTALATPGIRPAQALPILIWILPAPLVGSLLLSPTGVWGLFLGVSAWLWLAAHWLPGITSATLVPLYALLFALTVLSATISWIHNRDFREISQITAELATSQTFLSHIINSLDNPFYVINIADYSIELANEAARQLGVAESQTCYALTHRRDAPCDGLEHPCPLAYVRDTHSPYTVEHIHYKPDGSTYYAEVHGYPILDDKGNVVQMIEYTLDITERKAAEEEIRKLTESVEQSASSVVITDAEGTIEYVNPAFERISGYTADEAIGQNPRILKSGKMPPEFYQKMWATLLRGEIWRGEIVNRRKDGSLYWEFTTISPVKDQKGRITHFVSVKEDITARKEMEEALVRERQRTDALLKNILPEKVAEELKERGYVVPAFFENVTVMFADFGNFTQAAERLSPQELVSAVDAYFTAFDRIVDRHGLEKLKTIGDNYMCAGGIPEPSATHAVDVVRAALEMLAFIQDENARRRSRGLQTWGVRIGISSGPVIAGVVGSKKYAYDIWGDTVVMAARMEQAGEIGRINISRSTYDLIRPYFDCQPRGKVSVKHKGEVEMFFVTAPKQTAQ